MDPNQVPPQIPNVPPSPAPVPPPAQPLPQPPVFPAAPPPPPVQPPAPMPQPVAPPNPMPSPPPAPSPAPQVAQPPIGQYQPQPVQPVMYGGASGPQRSGGFKKLIKPIIAVTAVLFVLVVGYLVYSSMMGNKAEVQVGKDYVSAVQQKDTAALKKVLDPQIVKIGERFDKDGSPTAKQKMYDTIISDSATQLGSGEATKKSVVVSNGGQRKHAIVGFDIGSGSASVLEIYGDDGQPYVFAIAPSTGKMTDEQFDTVYNQYKSTLKYISDTLDSYEKYGSSDGASSNTLNSMGNLFQKQ